MAQELIAAFFRFVDNNPGKMPHELARRYFGGNDFALVDFGAFQLDIYSMGTLAGCRQWNSHQISAGAQAAQVVASFTK